MTKSLSSSLDELQMKIVLDAVQEWCSTSRVDIDSDEGRLAMTVAVDRIQTVDPYSAAATDEMVRYLSSACSSEATHKA